MIHITGKGLFMKKILLDAEKPFYKANLHCHSTFSDGAKTPEELKQMYMEHGYSVIAYTDHDVFIGHNELTDDRFLALNGFEIEIDEGGKPWVEAKTCHICLVALEPENLNIVCYHRTKYITGSNSVYRPLIRVDETQPDFERIYTPECINTVFAEGRKHGFFVTYNHPAWSLETLEQYGAYHGMNAMEICNYGCVESGYPDYNEKEYDELLRGGEKIFCIATDDNHNRRQDSFGGFTMINADRLEYRTITSALEAGTFYASQGPEIYELWYEDGKIGIKCSDAVSVALNTGVRRTGIAYATEKHALNEAVFDVKDTDVYVRLTVTDASGKHANTNAYFLEDLK